MMPYRFRPLTREGALACLPWRSVYWYNLRTPLPLSEEEQLAWHSKLPGRRDMRYWQAENRSGKPVAVFGLTDIEYENGRAQMSLIVDHRLKQAGIGSYCFKCMTHMAFDRMRLQSLYAEVYCENPAIEFWRKMGTVGMEDGFLSRFVETTIPSTKFINGKTIDSTLITYFPGGK
jgi:RimJ/RimL family protein N-acetyltransferase